MQRVPLGATGLTVSRLCLGCMTFGDPARPPHDWTLDEAASREVIRAALERGVTFFDTANSYSEGTSEAFLGRALRDFARRDEVVIATKVFFPTRRGVDQGGLSRAAIARAIDDSLTRLGVDHVDLYQIHRWDPKVPIEETLEALADVVRAGKARAIGASSMFAWQFAKALATSDRLSVPRFATMQNHHNLLYREEEREMVPLCVDANVALLPWSPLARGRLARPPEATTPRQASDAYGKTLYGKTADADRAVLDAVGQIAAARGVPRAQIALAWLYARPGVAAPIIGASRVAHLDDALAAMAITLDAAERRALEAPYVPHPVVGF